MFIIFGSPRSGTTFLRESLNQNPAIVIPHETDFIVPLAFLIDRIRDEQVGRRLAAEMIVSTKDFTASIGCYLAPSEVENCVYSADYNVPAILESLYALVAEKTGASIAGDKSPNDLGSFGILRNTQVFNSNIKVIHIVRDVRDVVLSLQSTAWAPQNIEKTFPGIWNNTNLNLRRFATQKPENYFFVRYEDLVAGPESILQPLCDFLDVAFDDRMLDWQSLGKDLRHLPHHKNLGQPPLNNRCYAWKNLGDAASFPWVARASEALLEFDYELASNGQQ